MKTKNTFSKLRRINNNLKDKLDTANRVATLQEQEIDRLNKAIKIKDITINSLEIKEKELSDKIYSMYDKLDQQTKLNNDNYNAWLDESKMNSNLSIGITVMSFIIIGLVIALIGVWK